MKALVSLIVGAALDYIIKFVASVISKMRRKKEAHDKQVEKAQESSKKTEDLKPDSSAKDVDEAIDDQLSHF